MRLLLLTLFLCGLLSSCKPAKPASPATRSDVPPVTTRLPALPPPSAVKWKTKDNSGGVPGLVTYQVWGYAECDPAQLAAVTAKYTWLPASGFAPEFPYSTPEKAHTWTMCSQFNEDALKKPAGSLSGKIYVDAATGLVYFDLAEGG